MHCPPLGLRTLFALQLVLACSNPVTESTGPLSWSITQVVGQGLSSTATVVVLNETASPAIVDLCESFERKRDDGWTRVLNPGFQCLDNYATVSAGSARTLTFAGLALEKGDTLRFVPGFANGRGLTLPADLRRSLSSPAFVVR